MQVKQNHFEYLKHLKQNNNREWFAENREWYDEVRGEIRQFFTEVHDELLKTDDIEKFHMHRINRDLRFTKDKTPYKPHFRLHLGRRKPMLRGGYYLNVEPGNCMVSGGFWKPESPDLLRIRQEISYDSTPLRKIFEGADFKKYFGFIRGEELKTAPRGFDIEDPSIDLLRKKQFFVRRFFTDEEALSDKFFDEIIKTFHALRPFFDYMSEVLGTDENGIALY